MILLEDPYFGAGDSQISDEVVMLARRVEVILAQGIATVDMTVRRSCVQRMAANCPSDHENWERRLWKLRQNQLKKAMYWTMISQKAENRLAFCDRNGRSYSFL